MFMVFLGSLCRETAKNAIKNKSMGKDDRKTKFNFFGQFFFTWTSPNKLFVVFLNSGKE
jgi:hypothetical protein